ncbi:MAG TPA: cytochrome b/b6 domain-containing protein [Anaeromyxobacteraceae bacterium]|nr:cytochrome b/b6 domain-containing protein [Anaeromyxobacteraceae bacterium]
MNRSIPGLAALVAAAALSLPAAAQQPVNPIHPVFAPLDAAGRKVRSAGEMDAEKTCGACHDAAYIRTHTGHEPPRAAATCVQCHVDGGRLEVRPDRLDAEGKLRRESIRIGTPRAQNCAGCHGIVSDGRSPVAIPAAFEAAPAAGRTWSLTQGEGAIVAPQRMSDSFLDLEGKDGLAQPWDVHAAKLVDCVACHYARNSPARTDGKQGALRWLTADPRRQTQAEFLVRPDHRLAEQECRGCHDPMKAHAFLPYRERHVEVLSCTACHAAAPMGPAAEMVDATVVTAAGAPSVRLRNVDRRPGDTLNTAVIRPLRPLLVERLEGDGVRRVAPVNLVSRYRWVSRADGAEVPYATLVQAWNEGGAPAAALVAALDQDRNGRIDEGELRLDTAAKVDAVAARLRALGVEDPVIQGDLEVHPLVHGISTRDRALRDCSACHAEDSRLAEDYVVASYLPGGVPPRPPDGSRVALAGLVTPTGSGGLALHRDREGTQDGLHVLGHSRQTWTNRIGFLAFLSVLLVATVHGGLRFALRRRRAHVAHADGPKEYVFGRYERIWHWTMALSGIVLIVTGLEVHGTGKWNLMSLPAAVAIHNAFAVVLMVNGFLALFYHLTTAAIRNFIPEPKGFVASTLEHMTYQARGIFYGESHPRNAAGQKLNPLQQVTYLALLNVLFPLQIATGVLIWAVGRWPSVASAVGGLRWVAPVHNLGSWLFLTFFVLHVYLVSTGRTPTDHLKSMITGYQHVDEDEPTAEGAQS